MRRVILTAALVAILITLAACGGHSEDAPQENLHPVLHDVTYQQIEEGREYVTFTSSDTSPHLSDKINAIHQEGYEVRHATSDDFGNVLLVFRKIPHPEESALPNGTTPTN